MAAAARIIAIIGPTASGKSALAMEVARRLDAEILSVDSMQVYRGMDIGTAKPTPDERRALPHHLIDVCEPTDRFTAARFVELADAAIAAAGARWIVAVGGTPMYFKALFEGLFDAPAADAALRERLRHEGNERLHARLRRVDPAAAARIHANDTKRLVRALEVFELTGAAISSQQREWGGDPRRPARWFGLLWEREPLHRRINARARQMLQAGWLDEARSLIERHGTLSQTAAAATGYAELFSHLAGEIDLDEATERIKIATRQLARRQMKWFRRFPGVRWLDGAADAASLADAVLAAATTVEPDASAPQP